MNPERCVVTLPIHSVENPNLFFLLSPLVADVIAKLLGRRLVLPINKVE